MPALRRPLLLACTSVALLAPAATAEAAWLPPFELGSSDEVSVPAVAPDGSGGYVVAWREEPADALYARHIDEDGVVGPTRKISTDAGGRVLSFDVDVDAAGIAVFAFTQGPPGAQVTRAKALLPDGTLVVIGKLSDPGAQRPSVDLSRTGEGVAAWQREEGGVSRVEARRVYVTGEFGGLAEVTDGAPAAFGPEVATASDGGALIAYTRGAPRLPYARYLPAGVGLGGEIDLDASGEAADDPQAVARPDGTFLVAFTQDVAGPDETVMARFVSPAGGASEPVTVSTAGADADRTHLAVAPDGTGTLAWRFRNAAGDPFEVQLRRLQSVTEVGPLVAGVATPVEALDGVDLAVQTDGAAVVTWAQNGDETAARQVAPDGTLGPLETLAGPSATNPRGAVAPAVATDGNGGALAAFLRYGGGAPDEQVGAARYVPPAPDGGTQPPPGGAGEPGATPGTAPGGEAPGARDLLAPVVSRLRYDRRRRIRFRVSEPVTARIVVRRRAPGRRARRVATLTRVIARAGAVRVRFRRPPGRYRVAVTAVDRAGNRTRRAVRRSFRIRPS